MNLDPFRSSVLIGFETFWASGCLGGFTLLGIASLYPTPLWVVFNLIFH